MPRRRTACRMVAFMVLLYAVYMVALVVFGILLRVGVLSGESPVGLTIVPAAIAGARDRRLPADRARSRRTSSAAWRGFSEGYRFGASRSGSRAAPATLASGTRTAIDFVREPRRAGGLARAGAVGFWAANIGILWAAFHAYDVHVPLGVVVQGFFVGMVANLFPFAPGEWERSMPG